MGQSPREIISEKTSFKEGPMQNQKKGTPLGRKGNFQNVYEKKQPPLKFFPDFLDLAPL